MKKLITSILCAMMAVFAFAGCAPSNPQSVDAIKKSGKLVVGTEAGFAPFEYLYENNVVGADMDIAKAIADELGVELVIENTGFETILTSVQNGKYALGAAGITVRPDRQEMVDFSVSYTTSTQYIIVRSDVEINNVADLAGKKIGVQIGTTGDFVIDDEMKGYFDDDNNKTKDGSLENTGAQLIRYANAFEAAAAMDAGKIDAVVIDKLPAEIIVEHYNNKMKAVKFLYTDGTDTQESYAICVAKGNDSLLEVVNKVLIKLINEGKVDEFIINHTTQAKG